MEASIEKSRNNDGFSADGDEISLYSVNYDLMMNNKNNFRR